MSAKRVARASAVSLRDLDVLPHYGNCRVGCSVSDFSAKLCPNPPFATGAAIQPWIICKNNPSYKVCNLSLGACAEERL
jgi:hypothetical protein